MSNFVNSGRYSHLSREDAIELLERRAADRRLGLVWERDEIEHERALNDDFVALDLISEACVGPAPYRNLLIEGDNFDALRALRLSYARQVKCIYIDPPYNTGENDFLYNDRFVSKENAYRHSTWLEFMYRRLELARDLLSDDGVMFISIDDNEAPRLQLLMDQVMPGSYVCSFVWRRRSGSNDSTGRFATVDHEYVLCFGGRKFSFAGIDRDESSYDNPDGDERGDWVNDNLVKAHTLKQRPDAFYPIFNPATDTWYAPDPDNVWRFATRARSAGKKLRAKPMEQLIEEKRILWPKNEEAVVYNSAAELQTAIADGTAPKNLRVYADLARLQAEVKSGGTKPRVLEVIEPLDAWIGRRIGIGKPRYKRFREDLKSKQKPISTWVVPAAMKAADRAALNLAEELVLTSGYTSEGTALVSKMLGNKDFPYPKPLSLLKGLIGQVTEPDRGHIVLDFFAGTGTAGHAVMALNDEDEGDRRFILVSSSEASEQSPSRNIARQVTRQRLAAAIDGYAYQGKGKIERVAGIAGEFAYLRAERIPMERISLNLAHEQVWVALQLMHGEGLSPYVSGSAFQVLSSDDRASLIYLNVVEGDVLLTLRGWLEKNPARAVVYSWAPGAVSQALGDLDIVIEKVPDAITSKFGQLT